MKKSDMVMIVLIATISMFASFLTAKVFFGNVFEGTAKVKTIDKIGPSITQPNKDIFNKDAINPAVQVQINVTGSGSSTKPSGTQ